MINRLTGVALRNRVIVVALYLGLAGWGWWALTATPIDAIPDLSDNQVIVFTEWPGHSPQEVEDQVTYPLTTNLQGLAGVRVVRSQSAFGFSMVYVVFEDDVDLYFARTRVLERMSLVAKSLPAGVTPTLGPDATGVGHVFWYTVESPTHSLTELRTLQDWFIRYQLNAVPGVAEVASVGGHVQQYQVDVDPNRLRTYHLPLSAVVAAVRDSNLNVGGNVLESNGAWLMVRGVGLIESVDDVKQIVVGASNGVPIYVEQVADVHIGTAFRVASLVKGTNEAVGGVVVARTGVNTKEVIDALKARIAQIAPGLPQGVTIVPFYDRSDLIEQAVDTLRTALIEEIALVTLAHVVFLMHFRSILIVTIPLPLAVLMSFLGMYYAGLSSNIMSLAGIAIAIGVLVDAGIVVTENAFRSVEQRGVDPRDRRRLWETVRDSTRLVGRPVFFSMAIILLAFIPVFALTGQEGKLFHPLAFTKTFAVLAATLIAVTLVPVLCTLLLGGKLHAEEANPVMRGLRKVYQPVLHTALAHRVPTITAAALLFVVALLLARNIGSEFMPTLNEGDLMFMPIADPSISLEENTDIAARQNAALMKFPEVAYVVAKVARADTSTDPAPLNMTETIVHLKPKNQWRDGMTLDRLRAEMGRAVQLPGVSNIWTMPIINRIDMLTTGIRSEVGVKIFGTDLSVLEELARKVAESVRRVRGASNVYPEQVTSGQYLNIDIDRAAAARYGVGVGDIQQVIEIAVGETPLTMTIEGRERFPVRVRYAPEYRQDPQGLGRVLVASPSGAQIPLAQLATIEHARGPAMISSENGLLLATVLLNVQGRDVGGFVEEARASVARDVALPPGYYVGWSGRWENQERARARLQVVLPIVLLIIFVLLYFTYHSVLEAAHVLLAVPFALTGGVYLLWLLGYNFSVAVWVGFIALFGTAVQTGVVMVIYLEEAVERKRRELGGTLTRQALRDAVTEGALLRLRPKVMTVTTVIAGLLPIMWSTRAGAEVMKPLATPVLGGMVSSLVHVLIVTPVIFFWIRERRLGLQHEPMPPHEGGGVTRRGLLIGAGVLALLTAATFSLLRISGPHSDRADDSAAAVIRTVRAGDLDVVLLSPTGTLQQGRNAFTIEFRRAGTNTLVDVGTVRASANMPMPGMVMSGGLQVERSGVPGRYSATAEFGMAGAWQDGHRMGWPRRQRVRQLRRRRAMTTRIVLSVLVAALMTEVSARAQAPLPPRFAQQYVDPVNGLSLEQAIARALEQEPSLRAARSEIDVARGMRQQASLRPNPSVSFERREEPAGTDNQTTVALEWPLDLFRRSRRVAVADHEVGATELAVADQERRLAAEVRMRYGDVVGALRDLTILDELVATIRRQHDLLRASVEEGATPPLERDLLDVELRRLESDRLLQAGRTEAALFHLKRVLGMRADASLLVRDTLEDLVRRESETAVAPTDIWTVLGGRADVREAAARVAVADAKIERAQAEGRFDVSLFANYMRMDAGFPQRGFTSTGSLERVRGLFHYFSAGAMITVPVLNRNEGEVAAARAEHAGAEAGYEAARLTAEAELAAARAREVGARQAVSAYTGARTLARQNLTVVGQSFDLGRVTVFDVLAEQRRYLDLERAYTDALRAAYEARTALNLALGGVR